jgi:hypothetical protein
LIIKPSTAAASSLNIEGAKTNRGELIKQTALAFPIQQVSRGDAPFTRLLRRTFLQHHAIQLGNVYGRSILADSALMAGITRYFHHKLSTESKMKSCS